MDKRDAAGFELLTPTVSPRGGGGLLLLLLALLWFAPLSAEPRLMVSPSRILFDGNTRSAEVTLINAGSAAGTFRISFVRKAMSEDGTYVDLADDESGSFSDPYIRYSPRQITLEPGQSQTVRLMLRKPADLAVGEYRSHMLFQTIPDASTTDVEEQLQPGQKGVTVRLIPMLGISIPVIVRQGKLEATATLSHLDYQAPRGDKPAMLSLQIERSGSSSLYGDLIVKYRPKRGGEEYVVGLAKGIAVYTPNPLRKFTVTVQAPAGVAIQGGELEVDYRQPDAEGGKLLASAVSSFDH